MGIARRLADTRPSGRCRDDAPIGACRRTTLVGWRARRRASRHAAAAVVVLVRRDDPVCAAGTLANHPHGPQRQLPLQPRSLHLSGRHRRLAHQAVHGPAVHHHGARLGRAGLQPQPVPADAPDAEAGLARGSRRTRASSSARAPTIEALIKASNPRARTEVIPNGIELDKFIPRPKNADAAARRDAHVRAQGRAVSAAGAVEPARRVRRAHRRRRPVSPTR